MWEVNKVSSIQFQALESNLRPSLLLFTPPSPISTIPNTGKGSLWFSSRTTFDFPSKVYSINNIRLQSHTVSGGEAGKFNFRGWIGRTSRVVKISSFPFFIGNVMWVDCFFLHKSIISTGKNCWTEVTYFKDRTTHCYTIALNCFFSLLWKAWKDCEDEDAYFSFCERLVWPRF